MAHRNKTAPLWQISITVAREAEQAVSALLERVSQQPVSIFAEEDRPRSTVTVYCSPRAGRTLPKRAALTVELQGVADCGLETGPAEIVFRRVAREDWAHSWKKYFKVIEIGSALLVKPSWSKRRPRKGQVTVTLDPGLSFGTGQHPTTAFCLEQLVATRESGQSQSFLDIGTGSGILAISAVKLGYKPVRALDNDPTAVRVAKKNARRNCVEGRLTIVREDVKRATLEVRSPYDLICANLVDELLVSQAKHISNRVADGGKLVLAGILDTQFERVRRSYEGLGLVLEKAKSEGGWHSGTFLRPC